jgi:hypothetical protein
MSGIESLGLPHLLYERPLDQAASAEDAARAAPGGQPTRSWFSFDEWSALDAVISIASGVAGAVSDTATEIENAPKHRQNREDASSNIMTETHEKFSELSFELTEQQMRWKTVERAPDIGQMTGDILGRIVAPQ